MAILLSKALLNIERVYVKALKDDRQGYGTFASRVEIRNFFEEKVRLRFDVAETLTVSFLDFRRVTQKLASLRPLTLCCLSHLMAGEESTFTCYPATINK
jgi:hypothetical protein